MCVRACCITAQRLQLLNSKVRADSGRFWLLDGIRRAPKEKGQSGRNRLRCSFSELQAQRIFSPSQQASMKCVLSS